MGGMDPSKPSTAAMFRRALVLRCPRCGSRKTFIKQWLGRYERCRTCGIRWHREHGFELGPISLNVVFTFFVIAVSMIVAFVVTAPNFPVLALTVGLIGAAIVLPLVAYPFTNTLWLALDLAVHQPDQRELDEADSASGRSGHSTLHES